MAEAGEFAAFNQPAPISDYILPQLDSIGATAIAPLSSGDFRFLDLFRDHRASDVTECAPIELPRDSFEAVKNLPDKQTNKRACLEA